MPAALPALAEVQALRLVPGAGSPVHCQDCGPYWLFYAPGYVCVAPRAQGVGLAARLAASDTAAGEPGHLADWAQRLLSRARQAAAEWQTRLTEPFVPQCLTLYLHSECNLRCQYCYVGPTAQGSARLEPEAVAAAAHAVATACARQKLPVYVAFHGGGEPALHPRQLGELMQLLQTIAAEHGVPLFRYIATNGVMPARRAAWLACHVDLVGLSCDGPPEIQDRQRPRSSGSSTARVVEQTARVLREAGCRLHVRATITRASLRHQAEIMQYLIETLVPEEVHFEPVYLGGRSQAAEGWTADEAREFVTHFLQARQWAAEHGVRLVCSGSRPGTVHGPYCHVLRQVLNLVPGNVATACFKAPDAARVAAAGVSIGAWNPAERRFELDTRRIGDLRRLLEHIPQRCSVCFNRYHCALDCPDVCMLGAGNAPDAEPGFRCLAQKATTYATLRDVADRLWAKHGASPAESGIYGTHIGD
jgi:MoaA/NifB/PqqE/SkfB family radical SAM enzyme